MKTGQCIWCLSEFGEAEKTVEHIIPEGLGCPPDFLLRNGEVCGHCNNGLGHLDQVLIDNFDFHAFLAGIPRKGGRPPALLNRGNVRGTVIDGKPTLHFNLEQYPIPLEDGTNLAPKRNSKRNVDASIRRQGNFGVVNYKLEFGNDPKFVRALYKVGFLVNLF